MLVINYGNELVSRVQALNACLVTVAIAPDHQSARGDPTPVTVRAPLTQALPGEGTGFVSLCLTALLVERLSSTQHSSAAKISSDSIFSFFFFSFNVLI